MTDNRVAHLRDQFQAATDEISAIRTQYGGHSPSRASHQNRQPRTAGPEPARTDHRSRGTRRETRTGRPVRRQPHELRARRLQPAPPTRHRHTPPPAPAQHHTQPGRCTTPPAVPSTTRHRSGLLPAHGADTATQPRRERARTETAASPPAGRSHRRPRLHHRLREAVADPTRGHLLWTGPEGDAFRGSPMSRPRCGPCPLTDANGGYMVPLTLDPAILLTSAGSINPLRRISRVETTVTDHGRACPAPAPPRSGRRRPPRRRTEPDRRTTSRSRCTSATLRALLFEVGQDALNFLSELQKVLVDAADQLMATAYTTGTGSGQPTGIITALAGGSAWSPPTVAESVHRRRRVHGAERSATALPGRGAVVRDISVLNTIARSRPRTARCNSPRCRDSPAAGKPLNELSNMDGAINAAATADNYVLLYGDFQHFVIVDRIGTPARADPATWSAPTAGRPVSGARCCGSAPGPTRWWTTRSAC